jgi:serine/threonine-protein kinase
MTEADPALIGRTIAGKFRVEEFLGGGAMGAVYKARQVALEKDVAVKVMHREVATDPQFAARFHREAKAASRLDHPNSMRVIDFGEEPDGLLYIAMEYLSGRDLYKVIHEDWPLSDARIADVLMQALAALAVAHDMGVIHRDLKPENIMVLRGKDDEGREADVVKVCDFGIAKITEKEGENEPPKTQGQKLTTAGLVVGTPEYMSPEQARGEKLDARSDIYSMGIILYQLLTGRVPFTADTALAIVLKHLTDPPEPPRIIYPAVNKALEAVCLKAIAKAKEERFQSARDMRSALRAAVDGSKAMPSPQVINAPTLPLEAAESAPTAQTAPPRETSEAAPAAPPPTPPAATAPTVSGIAAATPLGTEAVPRRSSMPYVAAALAALVVGGGGVFAATKYGGGKHASANVDEPKPHAREKGEPPPTPTGVPIAKAPDPTATGMMTAAPVAEPKGKTKGPHHREKDPVATLPTGEPAPPPPAANPPPPAATPEPPPPAPPPATTQAPPPPAPTPAAPAFDPGTCRVATGAVRSPSGQSARDLGLGGAPGAWTQCARSGIQSKPGGPSSANVTIVFSDTRRLLSATCDGCPGAMKACVEGAARWTSFSPKSGDITGTPTFVVPLTIQCE